MGDTKHNIAYETSKSKSRGRASGYELWGVRELGAGLHDEISTWVFRVLWVGWGISVDGGRGWFGVFDAWVVDGWRWSRFGTCGWIGLGAENSYTETSGAVDIVVTTVKVRDTRTI